MNQRFYRASYFTLFEVMIGLTLLLIMGSVVSWNVHKMVEKSRFSSDVSKIISQLRFSRQMALNTKLDWKFEMTSDQDRFRIQVFAPLSNYPPSKPSFISHLQIRFQGEEVGGIVVYFSPSGKIMPEGIWEFSSLSGKYQREVSTADLFSQKELPDKEGPKHPQDVEKS